MSTRPADLPDFKRPPLSEVVLSLQFEALENLKAPLIGVLWQRFRKRLPQIEEHPPLPQVFERFDAPAPPKFDVVVEGKLPAPRVWFLTPENTELIQIQQDRFIHNWRKVHGEEQYPRYEAIREAFKREVAEFVDFLKDENLGVLKVTQCEITYVNNIESAGVWKQHGEVASVLRQWTELPEGSFLPRPEGLGINARYVIPDEFGKPAGRLHVVFQPVWKAADNSPMFQLNLTARGRPTNDGLTGAFDFFDLGRRWIVKGFGDLTSQTMQEQVWGRIQ